MEGFVNDPDLMGLKVVKNGIHRKDPGPRGGRKPDWLKVPLPSGARYLELKSLMGTLGLHTVCQEAMCPNIAECWSHGTATIMILGRVCTRGCKFCAVDTGNPRGVLDPGEPGQVAEAVHALGLSYVVLTSVDRDDLADGGAAHFAQVVHAIKEKSSGVRVETLTPDFQGDHRAIRIVLNAEPDVFAHNLETTRRLTPQVRDPRAHYEQSLSVLRFAKEARPQGLIKTSLMLGLGESDQELRETFADLRAAGVDILTLGQYLRPTVHHLPVERYVSPGAFSRYRDWGYEAGFLEVFSGPLVRSSYRADRVFQHAEDARD